MILQSDDYPKQVVIELINKYILQRVLLLFLYYYTYVHDHNVIRCLTLCSVESQNLSKWVYWFRMNVPLR